MPLSVEMPAPVRTVTRSASASHRRACSIGSASVTHRPYVAPVNDHRDGPCDQVARLDREAVTLASLRSGAFDRAFLTTHL